MAAKTLAFNQLKSSVASGSSRSIVKVGSFNGLRSSTGLNKVAESLSAQLFSVTKAERTYKPLNAVPTCESKDPGLTIVFVSTEVAPWSKTGGLGDVLGGLPPALAALGHRVMSISPRYDQYKDGWDTSTTVDVKVGNKIETVRYFHTYKRGVDRVFVDHPLFLETVWGKTGSKLYGPTTGIDYDENQLRFSLFNQAALEAPLALNLTSNPYFSGPYGDNVVFVINDWHTGVLPAYLKADFQPKGVYTNAKVIMCTHNIAYQGRFAESDYSLLNLPEEFLEYFKFSDGYAKPVTGPKINWLKAGFLLSDKVITVSPNYAEELKSGPAKGVELDDVVREVDVTGIVNGMDTIEWDPENDKYLDVNYNATTVFEAKPALKEALQAEVGLPVNPDVPLFAFIGRLEEQKGSDILSAAVEKILEQDVQLIVLGTGKKYLEKQLEQLEELFPGKAVGIVKFNVPLAHQITAGADFFLVPSRFEPCGLIQLHAMRYGTIPVVASTGGLVDTVEEGVTGFHVGAFNVDCEAVDPADVEALAAGVAKATSVYGTPLFKEIINNAMAQDLSWKGPAKIWEQALLSLGVPGGEAGTEDGDEIAPKAKANIPTP